MSLIYIDSHLIMGQGQILKSQRAFPPVQTVKTFIGLKVHTSQKLKINPIQPDSFSVFYKA